MSVACIAVAVSEPLILRSFLKKLKKIETDFWGQSAADAKKDLDKARAEEAEKVAAAAAESSEE